jgi:hypothetical protein
MPFERGNTGGNLRQSVSPRRGMGLTGVSRTRLAHALAAFYQRLLGSEVFSSSNDWTNSISISTFLCQGELNHEGADGLLTKLGSLHRMKPISA